MRMAGAAGESSVMVVMPSKPNLQRPAPLSLPLSMPTADSPSDDAQATPDNSGSKRKRKSTDDGNTSDEEGDTSKTLYECRFCNMRFAKSQALGGHMNRHRQEREKEQYQHAQQLVNSMAHQQIPRTWNTMAELSGSSVGAAAQLARLSSQLGGTGVQSSRPDGSRAQFPPQISFNSTRGLPISTTSSPTMPDSSPGSTNYYLPSNSSSNNLQHLQWNVDGFKANHCTGLPRSGSKQGLSALDSLTGGMRDDFLSGVLQPRGHDAGAFGCQAQTQFSNSLTMPLLASRAALANAVPGSFHGGGQESAIQGVQGSAEVQFGHDHHSMRMNDVLRQLACSSPLSSTLMQSTLNGNMDAKQVTNAMGGGHTSASSPTFLMQCNNIVQFKQPQISLPVPRSLQGGNSTAGLGQYHVMSPPSIFSGHSFKSPAGASNFGSLPPTHDFNAMQDFESNMNAGMPGQYAVSRPAIAQTSSGSAASGSFGVSGGHEPGPGLYGHVRMQGEDDGYNQLSASQDHHAMESVGVTVHSPQHQPLLMAACSVVHEVVDGNHCESMNITTVTDQSGDVSRLSAPARYQSTDFSSGSPEWRTQQGSPSAQAANHASPPSQEYCSG